MLGEQLSGCGGGGRACRLSLAECEWREQDHVTTEEHEEQEAEPEFSISDKDGYYELQPIDEVLAVAFSKKKYLSQELEIPLDRELDATLERCPKLYGQIMNERAKLLSPPGEVKVTLQLPGAKGTTSARTRFEANGSYLFD
ncbi:MAG: hypothetical protein ACI841_003918 [Planctomycetota bacterium]|jgi:hypothetical protein